MAVEMNGKLYRIEYQTNGVFLSVSKPLDFGVRASDGEILDEIRRKRIRTFNAEAVGEAARRADGNPVLIAPAQEEESVNATCEVSTTPDKMQAFIMLHSPEGKGLPADSQTIRAALADRNVTYGINERRILELSQFPIYGSSILIAEGKPGQNGKNGEVHLLVDVKKDRKPTIQEDGTVNFKDMDMIENVIAGQPLAELVPPVKGILGSNIVGAELKPIDGKAAQFGRGRNVTLSADGQKLLADIDGQVMLVDGKISVFSTYEVHADVDNSTGNIHFVGNVVIRGNVLTGFSVEAGGNIEVQGVAEGATLIAGGSITLKRGMVGNGKGQISAGTDIIAKYIENCKVEAKGNIFAEAIMHSEVKCGNRMELGGKKGLLVGGIAQVGREIEAKVIGSQMSTATIIEVGMDPNLRERLKFLRTEVLTMDDNLKKSNQAITLLKKLDSIGQMTDDKREMLAKSTRAKFFYESRLMEYRKETAEIEEKLQDAGNGRVKVHLSCFNGVRVSIGSCTMFVKDELVRCQLYRDGADVRVGSL